MNSNMPKPEKFGRLHLVYHFTVPLSQYEKSIPHLLSFLKQIKFELHNSNKEIEFYKQIMTFAMSDVTL